MAAKVRQRGAAAVEFALVVPLLVLLVVGIAEFGRAYQVQTSLSGAARMAVRVMAVQNSPTAARAAAKTAAPTLNLTDTQIAVTPTTCASTGTGPPANATVIVTYPYHFLTGMFGTGVTMTGKGTMRCDG